MALFGRETEQDRQRAEAHAVWVRQRNPLAIASVVLGVFSLIEFGSIPIFSIAGLALGIVALRQLKQPANAQMLGHRLAWTGIALSSVALLTGTAIYYHSFVH